MKTENSKKLDRVLEELLKANALTLTRETLIAMSNKPLIPNADFMLLFRICQKSAKRWRDSYIINHLEINGRYYYLWTDVLELLKSRMITFKKSPKPTKKPTIKNTKK